MGEDQITAQSSHLVAQDRQVGELEDTYTKKTSDTSQRHVVNRCLAGGSPWCTEKVFLTQTEGGTAMLLSESNVGNMVSRSNNCLHSNASFHPKKGEQVQQPCDTLAMKDCKVAAADARCANA